MIAMSENSYDPRSYTPTQPSQAKSIAEHQADFTRIVEDKLKQFQRKIRTDDTPMEHKLRTLELLNSWYKRLQGEL